MAVEGKIRIGISGWRYAGWRGTFYPEKLAQRRELEFASQRFETIEINGTHYSLQHPASFVSWREETPPEFQFAVKGSRFITHMLKLRGVETALANFFAQGLLQMGPKLGPFLWQFPQKFTFDPERFDQFFTLLPKTLFAAAELAGRHGDRMKKGTCIELDLDATELDAPLRHAVEIRNDSFVCEDFIGLLRKHKLALVVADAVEWPLLMDLTADFVYCRLHGSKELYASGYGPKALAQWAKRVVAWSRGQESPDGDRASTKPAPKRAARDVYVYFDNDAKVRAPVDAAKLRKLVDRALSE
ncbi:MAG: DUF72 domain-containing protein [Terracidiphilus sp.]